MIEPPEIITTVTQPTALIRLTCPRNEIQHVMGPAIGEVMAAVTAQGIGPTGPAYAHHLRISPDEFDFEVGVPISGALSPTGRVEQGQLPATRVAKTIYRGGYEGLGGAWGEFEAWLVANGHQPDTHLWECYAKGPESSADPSQWQTELYRPLA